MAVGTTESSRTRPNHDEYETRSQYDDAAWLAATLCRTSIGLVVISDHSRHEIWARDEEACGSGIFEGSEFLNSAVASLVCAEPTDCSLNRSWVWTCKKIQSCVIAGEIVDIDGDPMAGVSVSAAVTGSVVRGAE